MESPQDPGRADALRREAGQVAATEPEALPPFVARRFNRVQAIVTALQETPLRPRDVAGLLGCTITSVRRDLTALRKAGIVSLVPALAHEVPAAIHQRFRLTTDAARIGAYLDGLLTLRHAQCDVENDRNVHAGVRSGKGGGCPCHVTADDRGDGRHDAPRQVRRDPLVTALFGNAMVARAS